MKLIITIIATIFISLLCSNLAAQQDYVIYRAKTGKAVSVQQMAKQLAKQKVIFFGEFHDDAICHKLELDLLQELFKLNPKIIVSFEMFERDVQSTVNAYLAGTIDEAAFLTASRPWPNYPTDYKPLLEFAKSHHLPVLAANVPRKYAGMIAKGGTQALADLPAAQKTEFAKDLKVIDDAYKVEFMKTMNQNMGHGMPGMPAMYDNMYAAQCLKDDTMAESISQSLTQQTSKSITIHYNGDFHSRSKLGTAQKLSLLQPKAKISVISPAYADPQEPLTWDKSLKSTGDYIILIHRSPDQQD